MSRDRRSNGTRPDAFVRDAEAARFRPPRVRPALPADPVVGAIALAAFLLIGTWQAYTVPYTGLGLSPAQLILLVAVALWFVTRLVGQRAAAGLGLLSALLVLRLAATAASYGLGWGRLLTGDQRTATNQALAYEAAGTGLVIVLATVLRSRRDIEFVLRALVAGGALSSALALAQYGIGVDLAPRLHLPGLRLTGASSGAELLREGLARSRGAAAAPLELGAVTAALVPLALGLMFLARRRGRRAWPWGLATLLLVGGGLVSLSRSVFLAAGLALLVMAARWPVRRVLAVLAGLVVAAGVALATGAAVVDAIVTVLTRGSDDFSLGSRSNGRSYVWAHVADHFWFGQGPGTYDLNRQPVLDNQYLSQLIETGALGALLLVAVLLCALAYALRATGRRMPPEGAELAIAVAGALAAVLVIESVLDTAGFVQIYTLIWLLVGLAAACWRVTVADARTAAPRRPGRTCGPPRVRAARRAGAAR